MKSRLSQASKFEGIYARGRYEIGRTWRPMHIIRIHECTVSVFHVFSPFSGFSHWLEWSEENVTHAKFCFWDFGESWQRSIITIFSLLRMPYSLALLILLSVCVCISFREMEFVSWKVKGTVGRRILRGLREDTGARFSVIKQHEIHDIPSIPILLHHKCSHFPGRLSLLHHFLVCSSNENRSIPYFTTRARARLCCC